MSTATTRQILVRQLGPQELSLLEQMHDGFEPKEVALGLPPRDAARRHDWLQKLMEGINVVALAEGRVAGHLAVMPGATAAKGGGQAGELAVFVHQNYRRQGVGTAMANFAVEEARKKGLHSLWVLISSDNSPARTGLLKYGFHTAWESMGEVKMIFSL